MANSSNGLRRCSSFGRLAGRRGRPVDGLAWPGRQDGSWQEINFPSPECLEIRVGAMRLDNVRSQCADLLPTAYSALYEIPHSTCGVPPPGALIMVLPTRKHSVACHTPDLCGCQSFSPSISNVAKTPSGRQGGIEQRAGTATSLVSGNGCRQSFFLTSCYLPC